MSIFAWLGETPSVFELRVVPNTRAFVGAYTPATQVLDMLGERWAGRIDLPPATTPRQIRAREAYFDRPKGQAHQISIWHFGAPTPLGNIGTTVTVGWTDAGTVTWTDGGGGGVTWIDGAPVLAAPVAQLANTALLQVRPGATVYAGDMLGLPNGQAVRAMADATADAAGVLSLEFQPRARTAIAAYGAINLNRPPITVMLKTGGGVPTTWQPGFAEGCSFEFIEVP